MLLLPVDETFIDETGLPAERVPGGEVGVPLTRDETGVDESLPAVGLLRARPTRTLQIVHGVEGLQGCRVLCYRDRKRIV